MHKKNRLESQRRRSKRAMKRNLTHRENKTSSERRKEKGREQRDTKRERNGKEFWLILK